MLNIVIYIPDVDWHLIDSHVTDSSTSIDNSLSACSCRTIEFWFMVWALSNNIKSTAKIWVDEKKHESTNGLKETLSNTQENPRNKNKKRRKTKKNHEKPSIDSFLCRINSKWRSMSPTIAAQLLWRPAAKPPNKIRGTSDPNGSAKRLGFTRNSGKQRISKHVCSS